jgi:hypothetical protein
MDTETNALAYYRLAKKFYIAGLRGRKASTPNSNVYGPIRRVTESE